MPHLILEHSANIETPANIREVLLSFHQVLEGSAGATVDACKSRIRVVDSFVVGDGDPQRAFVHLEIRLLEGRTSTQKKDAGAKIYSTLKELFSSPNIAVSIDFVDMDKEVYIK